MNTQSCNKQIYYEKSQLKFLQLTFFKNKKLNHKLAQIKYNREDRIRTCDTLVPNQVLYQAELLPVVIEYLLSLYAP